MYKVSLMSRTEVPGAPPFEACYRSYLEEGITRPEWWFALSDDHRDCGRVGFVAYPTCPQEFLGRLPAQEVAISGLWLPWDDPGVVEAGQILIQEAWSAIQNELPASPQVSVNVRTDAHYEQRLRVFERLGMQLFQEKLGFGWHRRDNPPTEVGRLSVRSLAQVGAERVRKILGRAGEATLDRNDYWYREMAGVENWSNVMMGYCGPENEDTWLVATDEHGNDVGMAGVSEFDEGVATISFIGIAPEHRGHGYIHELLRAATGVALSAGYDEMLSDADTQNLPMTRAFERNGHRIDHEWHKWVYRWK